MTKYAILKSKSRYYAIHPAGSKEAENLIELGYQLVAETDSKQEAIDWIKGNRPRRSSTPSHIADFAMRATPIDGYEPDGQMETDMLGEMWQADIRAMTYTTAEAAADLGLSVARILQAIRTYGIGTKRGRDWLLTAQEVDMIRNRIGQRGRPGKETNDNE